MPFRDPSQYGVFPEMYANKGNINEFIIHESSYKTTIIQIRKSNFIVDYFKYIVKSFLKSIFPKIYNKVIKNEYSYFDILSTGHHSEYINHLCDYILDNNKKDKYFYC